MSRERGKRRAVWSVVTVIDMRFQRAPALLRFATYVLVTGLFVMLGRRWGMPDGGLTLALLAAAAFAAIDYVFGAEERRRLDWMEWGERDEYG